MCTSLQWVSQDDPPASILSGEINNNRSRLQRIEIPYSAESSLGALQLQSSNSHRLAIRNAHRNYQLSFRCVFSRGESVSDDELHSPSSSSPLEWLPEDSIAAAEHTPNLFPFDCKYAPYNDARQLSADAALQTVYLSVWWSAHTSSSTKSLDGWNQVKLGRSIDENDADDFSDLDLLNIKSPIKKSSDFIEISVINCKVKASSCGKCLDAQLLALGCGWCRTNSKCTMEKDCPNSVLDGRPGWMNGRNELGAYCSHPRLTGIQPRCGPRSPNARTKIRLHGENLGSSIRDVQVRMRPVVDSPGNSNLDDLICSLDDEADKREYVLASQIVCRAPTPPPRYEHVREYTIYVVTKPASSAQFDEADRRFSSSLDQQQSDSNRVGFTYRYTEPDVLSVEPRRGIKSGGTLLRVLGRNLACGAELALTFTASPTSTCEIVNMTSSNNRQARGGESSSYSLVDDEDYIDSNDRLDEIYCRTPAYKPSEWTTGTTASGTSGSNKMSLLQTGLQIRMDEYVHVVNSSRFRFEYVDDPRVSGVDPDSAIASGGLTMNVRGRGFDSVQTAHLFLSPIPLASVVAPSSSASSLSSRRLVVSSSAEMTYDLEPTAAGNSPLNLFKSVRFFVYFILFLIYF